MDESVYQSVITTISVSLSLYQTLQSGAELPDRTFCVLWCPEVDFGRDTFESYICNASPPVMTIPNSVYEGEISYQN